MKYVRCTNRASTGMAITLRGWHVGLAALCAILCVAMTDWDLEAGAGEKDQPFAQIAQE